VLNDILLLGMAELHLEAFYLSAVAMTLTVASVQRRATCPGCGQKSERIHSRARRHLADVPCAGIPVRWTLKVRRFFCDNPNCAKTTFAERLPQVGAVWARRTHRLMQSQRRVALALGGEAGARLAGRLGMSTSPDTLLRLVRQTPVEPGPPVHILGVDDWAWQRGQRYGTLLVDLEQRQPVDLLPDRSAEALAQWLTAHPGIQVISRDRAGAYADGAKRGAPNAVQVADRWHLLHNLADTLEHLFDRQPASLRAATAAPVVASPTQDAFSPEKQPQTPTPAVAVAPTHYEQRRQQRRAKRLERYERVRRLRQQGASHRTIMRQLRMGPATVRRYLHAATFPEIAQRRQAPSILDPFMTYLKARWQAGCHNGLQLWREIGARGYTGSRPLLSRWVAQQRRLLPSRPQRAPRGQWPRPIRPPAAPRPLSSRRAAFLVLKPPEVLDREQATLVARFCAASPDVATASGLAREFADMVRGRQRDRLDDWLQKTRASSIRELKYFANGLQRDYAAVAAGLSLKWSNGPTEGHINRLKLLKRQMYGRANFDLLRQRVVHRS
jgi:transposase